MAETRTGRCLCGAVRITIAGPVTGPVACHCRECQRQSGNYWVAITAPRAAVAITGDVGWFAASDRARRGFCPCCGGFLFWEPAGGGSIDIALGSLDDASGLTLEAHLWCDEAPWPVPDDGTPHHPRGRPKPGA